MLLGSQSHQGQQIVSSCQDDQNERVISFLWIVVVTSPFYTNVCQYVRPYLQAYRTIELNFACTHPIVHPFSSGCSGSQKQIYFFKIQQDMLESRCLGRHTGASMTSISRYWTHAKNTSSFQWIFGSIWVNSHSYFGAPGPLGPAEVYPCDPVGLQMLTAAVAETQFFKRTLIEDISLRHFLHRGGLATAATE